jgi:hypothetical protein
MTVAVRLDVRPGALLTTLSFSSTGVAPERSLSSTTSTRLSIANMSLRESGVNCMYDDAVDGKTEEDGVREMRCL